MEESEVLILAKTKMTKARVCVGGIDINSFELLRLLTYKGNNQPENTNFKIGNIYWMEFERKEDCKPPHVEDVLVGRRKQISKAPDIITFLKRSGVNIWQGSYKTLFDKKVSYTSNKRLYIQKNLPKNSVGFWISDKDLIFDSAINKYLYKTILGSFKFSYAGLDPPLKTIPSGTLIRVSLARWWTPNTTVDERCYLQISCWYL